MYTFTVPANQSFEQIAQDWKNCADTISEMFGEKLHSVISYRLLKTKNPNEVKYEIVMSNSLLASINWRKSNQLSQYTSPGLLNAIRLILKDKSLTLEFDANCIDEGSTHVPFSVKNEEYCVAFGICTFKEYQKYQFINFGDLILSPFALESKYKKRKKAKELATF